MRFRCDRFSCQWVGNITGRNALHREAQGSRSWLKPGAVVLAALLACAGIIALALLFATDVLVPSSAPVAGGPSAEWKYLGQRLGTEPAAALAPVQADGAGMADAGLRR